MGLRCVGRGFHERVDIRNIDIDSLIKFHLADQIVCLLFGELLAPIRRQRLDDGVYLNMPRGRRPLKYLPSVGAG